MGDLEAQRIHNAKWTWWRGIGFDREASWLLVNGQVIAFGATECDILEVIFEKHRCGTKALARRVFGMREDVNNPVGTIRSMIVHIRHRLEDTGLSLVNLQSRNPHGHGGGVEGLYTLEWD